MRDIFTRAWGATREAFGVSWGSFLRSIAEPAIFVALLWNVRGEHAAMIELADIALYATAVSKMPVDGRCEDVIFFDGVFFGSSLTSIFFAP